MDTLRFTQNWNNKLSGKYYTTLRLLSAKYQIGKTLQVILRKKYLHKVKIKAITVTTLDKLNSFIIGLDMGLTTEQGIAILTKMYPQINIITQRFVLALCEVIPDPGNYLLLSREELQLNKNEQSEENQNFKTPETQEATHYNSHTLTENQLHHKLTLQKQEQVYTSRTHHG